MTNLKYFYLNSVKKLVIQPFQCVVKNGIHSLENVSISIAKISIVDLTMMDTPKFADVDMDISSDVPDTASFDVSSLSPGIYYARGGVSVNGVAYEVEPLFFEIS